MPTRNDINWDEVDWSLSNAEVSRQLRCNVKTVVVHRPVDRPTSGRPQRTKDVINWHDVDWSATDEDLSESLGVGYQTVRRWRKKAGEKSPRSRDGWWQPTEEEIAATDWTRPDAQIAAKFRVNVHQVTCFRRARLGIYKGGLTNQQRHHKRLGKILIRAMSQRGDTWRNDITQLSDQDKETLRGLCKSVLAQLDT